MTASSAVSEDIEEDLADEKRRRKKSTRQVAKRAGRNRKGVLQDPFSLCPSPVAAAAAASKDAMSAAATAATGTDTETEGQLTEDEMSGKTLNRWGRKKWKGLVHVPYYSRLRKLV